MKNLGIRITVCALSLLIGSISLAQGGPIIPSVKKLTPDIKGINSLKKGAPPSVKALKTKVKKKSTFRKVKPAPPKKVTSNKQLLEGYIHYTVC